MPVQSTSTFRQKPATRIGRWAIGVAGLFVLMIIINILISVFGRNQEPNGPIFNSGILILLVSLISGILALLAILRKRERSWLVWLALVPGIVGILALLADLLLAH